MKFPTNFTLSIVAGTMISSVVTSHANVKHFGKAEQSAVTYKYDVGDVAQIMLMPNQHVACEECGQQPLLANYVASPVKKLKLNPMPEQEENGPVANLESKPPEEEGGERILSTIRFAFNSAKLTKQSKSEIAKAAEEIRSLTPGRDAIIKVDGYTCKIGGKKYNDRLAKRRARAVAKQLRSLGVRVSKVAGEGVCCYVSKIDKRNRRAEVSLTGKEGAK